MHRAGDLIPVGNANHFTILDGLRQPDSAMARAVLQMAEYGLQRGDATPE